MPVGEVERRMSFSELQEWVIYYRMRKEALDREAGIIDAFNEAKKQQEKWRR